MENTITQKRLERIILINSSTFPYAEVTLDGNTHIAGDNSVGKSTFLQIATIFYTGETSRSKLGIGEGKKPFAQYNLPYGNSYIIYEVRRSQRAGDCYMVVLKNSSWPTFNFFDCPFRREMFMGEDNVAFDNLEMVRAAARRIYGASLDIRSVHGQDAYLDVIYGYRTSPVFKERSLERYSLTTCRGDNRPHSKFAALFTNFLNLGKVQGSELKEMIVSSLDSPSKAFDVPVQRANAAEVVRRYKSIETWLSDPYVIESKAQFVSAYEAYLKEMDAYAKYPAQAKFARNEALVSRREIEAELRRAQDELERYRQRAADRREAADSAEEALRSRIAVLESDLGKISQMKTKYSDLLPIIPLMGQEDIKRTLLGSISDQLDALQGESRELRDKVEEQKKALDASLSEMTLTTKGEISAMKARTEEAKSDFRAELEEERGRAEQRHAQTLDILSSRKKAVVNRQVSLQDEFYAISSSKPHGKKILSCEDRIDSLRTEIAKARTEVASLEGEIKLLEARRNNLPDKIRMDSSEELSAREEKLRRLTEQRDALQSKLSSYPGSFAQWLEENRDGWEKNLGKVVSDTVLFRSDLSPELSSEGGDTLYGVKLDTGRLPRSEQTPAALQDRIASLELRISSAVAALQKKRADVQEKISQGLSEMDSDIAALKKKMDTLTAQIKGKEAEVDSLSAEIASLREEQKRVVEERLSSQRTLIDSVKAEIASIESEELSERESYKALLDSFRARMEERGAQLDSEFRSFEAHSGEALEAFARDIAERKVNLDTDLMQALSAKGLDSDRIQQYTLRKRELQEQLHTIESNRKLYNQYQGEKEAYLDKEDQWKESLSHCKEDLSKSQSNEKQIREREENDFKEMASDIKGIEEDIAALDGQIQAVDEYYRSNRTEEYEKCEPLEVDIEATEIVACDKASGEKAQNLLTRMENCWMRFKSRLREDGAELFFRRANISPDIKTDFLAREDIYHFIKDGIIEDHIGSWKSYALSFVSGISYLASDYTQEIAKVRDTVVNLNRLFRENNFTEVIKRIELSVEDIGTELIALIQKSVPIYRDYGGEGAAGRNFFDGSSGSRTFIRYIQSLSDALNRYSSDKIRVEDMFDLKIEVDEGLNKSGRKRDIRKMGSNGIDIIFKDMVYLLMLANIRRKFGQKGEGFIVHCPVDEQSTLSPGNFNSLMNMANNLGVYVLANSPLFPAGTEDGFRYAYTFWKRPGSEVTNATRLFSLQEK